MGTFVVGCRARESAHDDLHSVFCAVTRRTMDTAPLGCRAYGVRPWEPPCELALNRGFASHAKARFCDPGRWAVSSVAAGPWGSRWLEWFAPPGLFWPVAGVTMPMQTTPAPYSRCKPPSVRHGCVQQARALFRHLLESLDADSALDCCILISASTLIADGARAQGSGPERPGLWCCCWMVPRCAPRLTQCAMRCAAAC
jgi:hypothetical protein